MKVKYQLSRWSKGIKKVAIERETEKCIWINGNRSAKSSDYSTFYDSFDEAKNIRIGNLKNNIEFSKAKTKNYEEELEYTIGLTDSE